MHLTCKALNPRLGEIQKYVKKVCGVIEFVRFEII
jgi:hypothetical protein